MAGASSLRIMLKRAYDPPAKSDGRRILVDRVWPRGLTKAALRLDGWAKAVAPSTELRRWFGHDPARWEDFQVRYRRELDAAPQAVAALLAACHEGPVTLIFGAKDTRHNQAVALKAYLETRAQA